MKDHVIVCGAGSTGRYIVDELVAARTPVLAIDLEADHLRELADRHGTDAYRYIIGDATDEQVLADADLANARGVVAALANDKDNIYIVVETKQINPRARIIAKASERTHIDKIRRVGADAIVSPPHIGGLRMVSEMQRPAVVRFMDDMLRDTRVIYRIDEVTIEVGSELAGVTLADAAIRQRFECTVIAITNRGGPWLYNPLGAEKLIAGMTLVLLGSIDQVALLRELARRSIR